MAKYHALYGHALVNETLGQSCTPSIPHPMHFVGPTPLALPPYLPYLGAIMQHVANLPCLARLPAPFWLCLKPSSELTAASLDMGFMCYCIYVPSHTLPSSSMLLLWPPSLTRGQLSNSHSTPYLPSILSHISGPARTGGSGGERRANSCFGCQAGGGRRRLMGGGRWAGDWQAGKT